MVCRNTHWFTYSYTHFYFHKIQTVTKQYSGNKAHHKGKLVMLAISCRTFHTNVIHIQVRNVPFIRLKWLGNSERYCSEKWLSCNFQKKSLESCLIYVNLHLTHSSPVFPFIKEHVIWFALQIKDWFLYEMQHWTEMGQIWTLPQITFITSLDTFLIPFLFDKIAGNF